MQVVLHIYNKISLLKYTLFINSELFKYHILHILEEIIVMWRKEEWYFYFYNIM